MKKLLSLFAASVLLAAGARAQQTVGTIKFLGSTSGNTILKATAVASGTITLPTGTDTLADLAGVQAFTNKTYNGLSLTAASVGFTIAGGTTSKTATIAGNFTTAHGDDLTLTTTGSTNVTLPISGTLATTTQLPTAANPTATISSTAGTVTNGSASTFMRSDGAPALPATYSGLNTITSAALSPLVLATGTSGTAVTFASATNIATFASGIVGTTATLNTVTSVAGQPHILATGTTGTAITIASADNSVLLSQGTLSFTGATTITGGAGNMTQIAGTGNSRTWTLQTTTSGGTATTAMLAGADQSVIFSNGTAAAPSFGVNNSGRSGFYSIGSSSLGMAIRGTGQLQFNDNGTSTDIYIQDVTGQQYLLFQSDGTTTLNAKSGKTLILQSGGSTALTLGTSQQATFISSITTGAPTTGTAGAWKLGIKTTNTLLAFDTANSVQLDIAGTLYHVALATITTP